VHWVVAAVLAVTAPTALRVWALAWPAVTVASVVTAVMRVPAVPAALQKRCWAMPVLRLMRVWLVMAAWVAMAELAMSVRLVATA
jgi:hypothetical protein